jgi:ABC-type transport system involved in multi-copper enzyme maturation permease subunit
MKIVALIMQTLRELIAKATLIFLAGISTLIIVVLLLGLSSTEAPGGVMLTIFGLPITPAVTQEQLVQIASMFQATLAGGLFGGLVLFGVFATAGVIPEMLEKGTVDLYLSKPLPRWELLLGKFLGAVFVVLVNVVYFIGALWMIFGLKVGVWNAGFLVSSLTVTFVFACLFSIVAHLGVTSRNMAIPIIGAFLYLFIIGPILENREHTLYLISGNEVYRSMIDAVYWVLPQLSAMQDAIKRSITGQPGGWVAFLQSFLSASAILGWGAWIFQNRDF